MSATVLLLRAAARRDRPLVLLAGLVLAAVPAASYSAYERLYPAAEARQALDRTLSSAGGLVALYGRVDDLGTAGGFTAWRAGVWGALFASLVAAVVVVRHSRAEEEDGRTELVLAGVVPRTVPVVVALAAGVLSALVIGAAESVVLVVLGAPAAGSLAFGAGTAAAGASAAVAAGLVAELVPTAHQVTGLAVALVGAAYLARAVGDVQAATAWGVLTWLSPLGWAELLQPFTGERWAVLALPGVAVPVGAGFVLVLRVRRDLGSAVLGDRPGPARASGAVRRGRVRGLQTRLLRPTVVVWLIAAGGAATGFGALVGSLLDVVRTASGVSRVTGWPGGARALLGGFTTSMVLLFAAVAAAAGVHVVLRLVREEPGGRLDLVLSRPVSRTRWWSATTLAGYGTAVSVLTVAAVGFWSTSRSDGVAGDWVLSAALAQLPAVLVLVAIALLGGGVTPRAGVLAWLVLALALLLALFAPAMDLPAWVVDASPFTHAPLLPDEGVRPLPSAVLGGLAVLATVGATWAFARRNLQPD